MKIPPMLAPVAMAFGLSACGPVEADITQAVCKADLAGISNSDPGQRFKIVDAKTNQPLFFSSPAHVRVHGHQNLLSKAVDAVFQPRLTVRDISTDAVIQKTDDLGEQIGWEVASDLSFNVELDNKGEIVKCSILNKEGDGVTYNPVPTAMPAP